METTNTLAGGEGFWIAEEDRQAFREGVAAFYQTDPDDIGVEVNGMDLLSGAYAGEDSDGVNQISFRKFTNHSGSWMNLSGDKGKFALHPAGEGLWMLQNADEWLLCLCHEQGLQKIPEDFSGTVFLYAPEMQKLPTFSAIRQITEIWIHYTNSLIDFHEIRKGKKLKTLFMQYISDFDLKRNILQQIGHYNRLAGIDFFIDISPQARMITLTDISPLAELTGLTTLNLSYCNSLTDISPLAELTGLTTLNLSHCNSLTDISPLVKLTGLTTLDLSHCNSLTDISSLSALTALTTLDLSSCKAVC